MKGRIWKPLVLTAVVFAMQLPAVLYGFDVNDTGYYLTFYRYIFSHPEAVSHNFMYYGSGLVGGLLLRLCGGSLLWMRIFGALCNVLISMLVWWVLKGPRTFLPVLLAAVVITVGSWSTPMTFYNDIMSTLLATLTAVLLIKAVTGGSSLMIFLAGLVAGINLFTRIPNVLQVLMVVPLALAVRLKTGKGTPGIRMAIRACRHYLSGWLSGICVILVIALAAGHLPYLLDSLADLVGAGAASGADSSHSLAALIRTYLLTWLNILFIPLSLIFPSRFPFNPLLLAYTVTVAGLCVACFRRKSSRQVCRSLRPEALFALAMIILLPAGSDYAIYNAGPILLWLALPTALISLAQLSTSSGSTAGKRCGLQSLTIAIATLMTLFFASETELYFDSAPISNMTAEVAGIRTTSERAARIEGLCSAIERDVPEDATLMVFDSAPMLNYLTDRSPAGGVSWPALLTPKALQRHLTNAPDFILVLNFPTLTGEWPAPYPEFAKGANLAPDGRDNQRSTFHNRRKSAVIQSFIKQNGYRRVAISPDYTLYRHPDNDMGDASQSLW